MDSAWLTMSRLRPVHSCRSTWLNGSSRAPNLLFVRRTPLATARTLPCRRVSTVTIRSASPSFWVRRTIPSSRYSDLWTVLMARLRVAPLLGRWRSLRCSLPRRLRGSRSVPQPVELLGVVLPLPQHRDVQLQVHPRAEQLLEAHPRLG